MRDAYKKLFSFLPVGFYFRSTCNLRSIRAINRVPTLDRVQDLAKQHMKMYI